MTASTARVLPRRSLAEQAYTQLVHAITRLELAPGEVLVDKVPGEQSSLRAHRRAQVVPISTLEDGATSSPAIAWSKTRRGPYMPTPIVYGDHLYMNSNNGIVRTSLPNRQHSPPEKCSPGLV